jgi:Uma2 family endonuclease
MGESGVFAPGQRVELLEGEIVEMMPIGPYHSGVVGRLLNFFAQIGGSRWTVQCQNPVQLSNRSEPVPDVVLLRPDPNDYTTRHPAPEDVLLLIEVADSSVAYDREDKLPAYAKAGIQEYWLVNLVSRQIEVFREPNFLGYEVQIVATQGDKISPAAFADVEVDVASILRVAR